MTDRHPEEEVLLDLALSDVDEHQRDVLTRHLAVCEGCRATYAAIALGVDRVLLAAPRVAPPAGFSRSVLAAMGIAEDAPTATRHIGSAVATVDPGGGSTAGSRPAPVDSRPARRRLVVGGRAWVTAAVAALGLLVGVGGAVVVLDSRTEPTVQAAAGPALVTNDGTRVGTVLPSRYQDQPVLVVTLTDGTVGVRYECRLVFADGSRQAAGSWVLRAPEGATWVVSPPAEGGAEVTGLELVTDEGATWATAAL